MKICNKCNIEKPLEEFFKDKNNKTDGHYSICKTCKNESANNWRESHRDKYNATMRQYNKDNYERLRLNRYDLTPAQHAEMLNNQHGVCAICGKIQKGKRPLVVNHDHETGKVRGLLCYGCNRIMAALDNEELLKKATEYKNKLDNLPK